jgi:hypothetical protein
MGVNNRQRRRAKQQRRRKAEGARRIQGRAQPAAAPDDFGGLDEQAVRAAVLGAAQAYQFEPRAAYDARLEALSGLSERAGPAAVEGAVGWWIERALDRAWGSGWQPADVVRAVRRRLSPRHAEAVGAVVAASAARRPEAVADCRWADQVAVLAGTGGRSQSSRPPAMAVPVAVEVVSVLFHLPPLPRLSGSGGGRRPGRRGSGAMLQRVRALLAKAESTTFPDEAEALTAKAQELMARHAIDDAMLDSGGEAGPVDVVGWRIGVDDPYAAAKSQLLHCVATANRCRAVWSQGFGFSTVFGVSSDLEMVELLFTSLLVQGTEAMVRAGRSVDRAGRSRTRSFRHSFLLAYAGRIGERLAEATASVVAEGRVRHGAAMLPVLASRAEAVEETVRLAFPHLVQRGATISNYSGWAAGRAAAELASLAVGAALEPAGS